MQKIYNDFYQIKVHICLNLGKIHMCHKSNALFCAKFLEHAYSQRINVTVFQCQFYKKYIGKYE